MASSSVKLRAAAEEAGFFASSGCGADRPTYAVQPASSLESTRQASIVSMISRWFGLTMGSVSPQAMACARNVRVTSSR